MAMLGPCPQPLKIPLSYQTLAQPCRGGDDEQRAAGPRSHSTKRWERGFSGSPRASRSDPLERCGRLCLLRRASVNHIAEAAALIVDYVKGGYRKLGRQSLGKPAFMRFR